MVEDASGVPPTDPINTQSAIVIDISGASAVAVPVPPMAEVIAIPGASAVAVPVPPMTEVIDVSPAATGVQSAEYQKIIHAIITDLSGASVSAADLFRYIPRLSAHVQSLDLPNADKRALVIAGGHELVNRLVPEAERAEANRLVDTIFPAAIAGVIDLARGRVSFPQAVAAAAPVVAEVGRVCLPRFLAWIRTLRK